MSSYKYVNPLQKGFKQFKLTRKQHNCLFPKNKRKWYNKYEYYYNEDVIILHRFTSWKAIVLTTVLFPISLILYGLTSYKELHHEMKRLYHQKKYGSFVSEYIHKDEKTFDDIMKLIQ